MLQPRALRDSTSYRSLSFSFKLLFKNILRYSYLVLYLPVLQSEIDCSCRNKLYFWQASLCAWLVSWSFFPITKCCNCRGIIFLCTIHSDVHVGVSNIHWILRWLVWKEHCTWIASCLCLCSITATTSSSSSCCPTSSITEHTCKKLSCVLILCMNNTHLILV